jgi:hypothetical protein
VAKQTHSPWRGDPTKGADLIAPTAPHARPGTADGDKEQKRSGPAKFWSPRRVRIALSIGMAISLGVHWWVAPWNLLPPSSGIEIKDPAGELAIPIDILGEETPPPPPPPPPAETAPPPPTENADDPNAPGHRDAGAPRRPKDAGIPLATLDAGIEEEDGGAPADAGTEGDGGITDAGAIALNGDGGTPGENGPRDPESMFGLSKAVHPGTVNVTLGVNVALIRQHPVGARMGPIMQSLPQWRDFLKGSQAAVEPIRDTDWILIYGPSLIHTDRDAVLVRYNANDSAVDQTIAGIAKTYDKGGSFDAGVPGVKAVLGFADNGQRVFLRPQSKLLVIVPPSHAHEAAVVFRKQVPKGPPAKEAMRLVVKNPANQIAIRGLKFDGKLTEIRLWIVPQLPGDGGADGGADVYAEGDCTDEATANDSADKLTELLKNQNSIGVRIATRGLLNNAKVVADGTKIKLHVAASQEQLEAILQLVAASLNVTLAPPPGAPISPPTTPMRPRE